MTNYCQPSDHLSILQRIVENLSPVLGVYTWEDGTKSPAVCIDYTPDSTTVSGVEAIVDCFPDMKSGHSSDSIIAESWYTVTLISHDHKEYFQQMQRVLQGIQSLFLRIQGRYYPPTSRFHEKPTYVLQIWVPTTTDSY